MEPASGSAGGVPVAANGSTGAATKLVLGSRVGSSDNVEPSAAGCGGVNEEATLTANGSVVGGEVELGLPAGLAPPLPISFLPASLLAGGLLAGAAAADAPTGGIAAFGSTKIDGSALSDRSAGGVDLLSDMAGGDGCAPQQAATGGGSADVSFFPDIIPEAFIAFIPEAIIGFASLKYNINMVNYMSGGNALIHRYRWWCPCWCCWYRWYCWYCW